MLSWKRRVSLLAHKLNSISFFVQRAIRIFTRLTDFDVGLIHTMGRAAHLQIWTDALVNFARVSLNESERPSSDPHRVRAHASSLRHRDKKVDSDSNPLTHKRIMFGSK